MTGFDRKSKVVGWTSVGWMNFCLMGWVQKGVWVFFSELALEFKCLSSGLTICTNAILLISLSLFQHSLKVFSKWAAGFSGSARLTVL